MKLCVPTPALQCANAISCNCWETGSVCYLPRLKVTIQHPPSVFIKTLFKLTPGWQSKNCIQLLWGKLVAATLKLRINSCGGAGSQRETQSDPSETNNSCFPGRLLLLLPLLLLRIMHSSAHSTQTSLSSPVGKAQPRAL